MLTMFPFYFHYLFLAFALFLYSLSTASLFFFFFQSLIFLTISRQIPVTPNPPVLTQSLIILDNLSLCLTFLD
uniref:Uncharacterized protein n=1 Tax=Saccharolobus islandicus TaxID=43080 RepID=Q54321_SACIS|nr:ORF72; Method: conceptual translation supplied by author [Sulfolobus islandicus]BAF62547.1 orf72 [synthetic construct]